jgi:hypothetical protein
MDLASLLASAFKPPTGPQAPHMYDAQGTNSAWLMPGRDVRAFKPPTQTASVPLPPRDPRGGGGGAGGAGGGGGGGGGGGAGLPLHEAATGMTVPSPSPYMYGGGNEVIPEAATGMTYPTPSLPHPNPFGPPGGEAASGMTYPQQAPYQYGGGNEVIPQAATGATVPSTGISGDYITGRPDAQIAPNFTRAPYMPKLSDLTPELLRVMEIQGRNGRRGLGLRYGDNYA